MPPTIENRFHVAENWALAGPSYHFIRESQTPHLGESGAGMPLDKQGNKFPYRAAPLPESSLRISRARQKWLVMRQRVLDPNAGHSFSRSS